jgi:hypothetical protein
MATTIIAATEPMYFQVNKLKSEWWLMGQIGSGF